MSYQEMNDFLNCMPYIHHLQKDYLVNSVGAPNIIEYIGINTINVQALPTGVSPYGYGNGWEGSNSKFGELLTGAPLQNSLFATQ
jgi:hypothetical protein